jgi:hypothetical protein
MPNPQESWPVNEHLSVGVFSGEDGTGLDVGLIVQGVVIEEGRNLYLTNPDVLRLIQALAIGLAYQVPSG